MDKSYTTFYIVRHGETEWNAKGIIQGQADPPLNNIGKQQAEFLGKDLNNVQFDAVFSSDLLRAKQTAELVILEKKMIVTTSQLLRERSYGKHQGVKIEKYRENLKHLIEQFETLSEEEKFKFKYDGEVESDDELVSRFLLFLREVAVGYEGKTILLVSHGGMIRALLIHLGFGKQSELARGAVRNSGYVKLISDGVDLKIIETKNVYKVQQESAE